MVRDLNETLIFTKVVEQGSFTAAAQVLGVPKTTVSRKVRELEARLGVRLLNRTTRKLSLTEAGATYFAYSSRIEQDLADAENAVHQLEGSPRGWLRISVPYVVCMEALSTLIRDFRALYPEVRLDLVLSNDHPDLIGNRIDVALRVGPLPDSSLIARTLKRFPSFVYAGEAFLARHGEPRIPADLEGIPALAAAADGRNGRYGWSLRNGGRSVDVTVDPVAVANDPLVLRGLLARGDGVMLTNELAVYGDLQAGRVRRILDGWGGPETELSAVFPGGGVVSPKVRAFVDFLTERLRNGGMCCPGDSDVAVAPVDWMPETA